MIDMDGTVTIEQVDRQLLRLLEGLGERAMMRFLSKAGDIVEASIRKNFAKQGRPKWEPLAPSTIRRRARATGRSMKSMGRRTGGRKIFGGARGKMAQSVLAWIPRTWGFTRDHVVMIGILGSQRGRVWKPLEYLMKGSPHQPGRQAIVLQPEDVSRIMKAMGDTVDRALGKR